jgi:hypothetical protein
MLYICVIQAGVEVWLAAVDEACDECIFGRRQWEQMPSWEETAGAVLMRLHK